MSNPIDLLLKPTHDTDGRFTLKTQWVTEFLTTGFLKSEHFLERVKGSPVWLEWVKHNSCEHEAANIVVQHLRHTNFDWMSPTEPNSPVRCIESIFPYCNADTLDAIFTQLPKSALDTLKGSVFDKQHPNLSILSAVVHITTENDAKKMVGTLIKWGWNIEQTNERGETLLLQTTHWGHAHILLESGANVLAVDHSNNTVFDRVRDWAHRSRFSSSDIIKTINGCMRAATPTLTADAQKKTSAITTLFSQISQEKTGDIKKTLAVLRKTDATFGDLQDVAGRTLMQVARDQIFKHSLQGYDQSHARFFSRLFVILTDNHEPGGLIDLDQAFVGHAHWSDRDVLNMTLLTLASHRDFNDRFLTSSMQETLKIWQNERFPSLVASLQDFFQPLVDNEQGGHVRDILTAHTTEKPNSRIFFNTVSHCLNALPFEHPMVQIVVEGLRAQHEKHMVGDIFDANEYDNVNVLAEELLWAARYCKTHNLDNNHPLVKMMDVQVMAMWGQWYIGRRMEVGDTEGYRTLQHADRKMFQRFVVERSHQIDQMDANLFEIWHTAQLKHHNVLSLHKIEHPHMDSSTLDLITRIEAQVLHTTVQRHIGTPLQHTAKRKI